MYIFICNNKLISIINNGKIYKPLTRLTKEKNKKTQVINIRYIKVTTSDSTDIKRIIVIAGGGGGGYEGTKW